jgi:type I restriction enzyme R subunit
MNSNSTFLPPVFKDLAEASHKAEEQIMGDPRAACFHARFALEAACPLALPLRHQSADAV